MRLRAVRYDWMAFDIISSVVSFLVYKDIRTPWGGICAVNNQ